MRNQSFLAGLCLGLATVIASAQPAVQVQGPRTGVAGNVRVEQGENTPSMLRLVNAANRLNQSIQALSSKQPGPQRDVALANARAALKNTQLAMINLPPEYRAVAVDPGTHGHSRPVRSLMEAADELRHAIQSIAQEPAGPRRIEAIRNANRALLDTQFAMASAYDADASGPSPSAQRAMQ